MEEDLRTELGGGGANEAEREGVELELANRGEVARCCPLVVVVGVEAREDRLTPCAGAGDLGAIVECCSGLD